ncbi:hypothetical protein SISSUDRAFT_1127343 [Sistotremastrum suecicum HHB10207 ss-3]|uniref:Zinc-finger domain-containing protein n=1 Tax=Sistotremastrum suecicum HHB10207 ss-3 TaxID=1314776 RepID=A0A166F610_9AGAM|nr:hypothetical protein SISSUDRAFT_1127343 [Sistotremastrum suecicum HHB10207 ss-3]
MTENDVSLEMDGVEYLRTQRKPRQSSRLSNKASQRNGSLGVVDGGGEQSGTGEEEEGSGRKFKRRRIDSQERSITQPKSRSGSRAISKPVVTNPTPFQLDQASRYPSPTPSVQSNIVIRAKRPPTRQSSVLINTSSSPELPPSSTLSRESSPLTILSSSSRAPSRAPAIEPSSTHLNGTTSSPSPSTSSLKWGPKKPAINDEVLCDNRVVKRSARRSRSTSRSATSKATTPPPHPSSSVSLTQPPISAPIVVDSESESDHPGLTTPVVDRSHPTPTRPRPTPRKKLAILELGLGSDSENDETPQEKRAREIAEIVASKSPRKDREKYASSRRRQPDQSHSPSLSLIHDLHRLNDSDPEHDVMVIPSRAMLENTAGPSTRPATSRSRPVSISASEDDVELVETQTQRDYSESPELGDMSSFARYQPTPTRPKAPSVQKEDDHDVESDNPVEVVIPKSTVKASPSKPKFGPKRGKRPTKETEGLTTCHQCRTTKPYKLMQCSNCPFKWCKCLTRWYQVEYDPEMTDLNCPKCRDVCSCSFCRRKNGVVHVSFNLYTETPAYDPSQIEDDPFPRNKDKTSSPSKPGPKPKFKSKKLPTRGKSWDSDFAGTSEEAFNISQSSASFSVHSEVDPDSEEVEEVEEILELIPALPPPTPEEIADHAHRVNVHKSEHARRLKWLDLVASRGGTLYVGENRLSEHLDERERKRERKGKGEGYMKLERGRRYVVGEPAPLRRPPRVVELLGGEKEASVGALSKWKGKEKEVVGYRVTKVVESTTKTSAKGKGKATKKPEANSNSNVKLPSSILVPPKRPPKNVHSYRHSQEPEMTLTSSPPAPTRLSADSRGSSIEAQLWPGANSGYNPEPSFTHNVDAEDDLAALGYPRQGIGHGSGVDEWETMDQGISFDELIHSEMAADLHQSNGAFAANGDAMGMELVEGWRTMSPADLSETSYEYRLGSGSKSASGSSGGGVASTSTSLPPKNIDGGDVKAKGSSKAAPKVSAATTSSTGFSQTDLTKVLQASLGAVGFSIPSEVS